MLIREDDRKRPLSSAMLVCSVLIMAIEECSSNKTDAATNSSSPVWNTCHSCGRLFIVNEGQNWQCSDCRKKLPAKKLKWDIKNVFLHPPWQTLAWSLICIVPVCLLGILISMTYLVSVPWGLGWAVAMLLVGPAALFISMTLGSLVKGRMVKLQASWEKLSEERQERARRKKEEEERQKEDDVKSLSVRSAKGSECRGKKTSDNERKLRRLPLVSSGGSTTNPKRWTKYRE